MFVRLNGVPSGAGGSPGYEYSLGLYHVYRVGTLCDCETDMGLTRAMAVPYSTLVLDMINAVTIGSSFQYFPKE